MRARNIKPGFYKNDQLAECSLAARLLFPGLWMMADREGRLEYRPKRIKAEVFPYDDVDVSALVGELAREGLVFTYKENGAEYLWIPNFAKHQNPHKNEKLSEIPPYSEENSSNYWSAPVKALTTRAESLILNPERGILNPEVSDSSLRSESSCPEPSAKASEPQQVEQKAKPGNHDQPEPAILTFPLAKKGETFAVTQPDIGEWQESFPGIDVLLELRHCLQWSRDNPTRRKTKAGIRRHITSWLAKAQDRARAPTSASPGQGGQTVRRTANQQYMHEVGELLEAIDAFDENGCGQRVGATAPALPGGGAQRQIDQHTG